MIEKPIKKQHYVWRKHLHAWTKSGKINVYLKDKHKYLQTDLMNVAQQRFFYKMEYLNDNDIKKAFYFLHSWNNLEVEEESKKWLIPYIKYSIFFKCKNFQSDEILKDIEINTFEKLFGKFENIGRKLLNCKSIDDLKSIDGNELTETLFYISVQYFRTKKIREDIQNKLENKEDAKFLDKIWNVIIIHLSLMLLYNALRNDITFIFVINKSEKHFITSDQPVINDIEYNGKWEDAKVTDFEFFYPISPNNAVVVQFGQSKEKYKSIEVETDWVERHNMLMRNSANNQIFADNIELLKNLN